MTVSITKNAAMHVADQLETRGHGLGIRVGVTTTGCSGMAYVLEFVDKLEVGDQIFEDRGIKIIVDPKSLVYINGTEMDFVKQGVNEGFEFKNPNAKGECGCGESFRVQERASTIKICSASLNSKALLTQFINATRLIVQRLNQNFFQLFDLPESFYLDVDNLSAKYRDMQTEVHPDKFAAAPEQDKMHAVQMTSYKNAAY